MNAFSVLYENDEILLINKPSGTAVQGGEGVAHPLDVELSKQLGYKIHLVHRLDKDTAGILIVAKSAKAAGKWTNLISTAEVQKEYYAITVGKPVVKGKVQDKGCLTGTVEAHGRTQSAQTFFTVEKTASLTVPAPQNGGDNSGGGIKSSNENQKENHNEKPQQPEKVTLSLIRIKLGTGRMHQIRIQMAQAQAPLAGDDQHGNFKINKKLRRLGIKKLCLCSFRLTIPVDGQKKTFEIPLPEYMQKVVDIMED